MTALSMALSMLMITALPMALSMLIKGGQAIRQVDGALSTAALSMALSC